MTRHLVTGADGQDGTLLCRLLSAQGDHVVATSLSGSPVPGFDGPVVALDVRDTAAYLSLIRSERPDVVHHLAAVSSVGASWEDPALTKAVNEDAVVALLEALEGSGPRFVHASSSEIFGEVSSGVASPSTPIAPVNPYGEAKAAAHRAVAAARSAGLQATNLILFGHTSSLHAPGFVLPTLVRQAVEVARGTRTVVTLRDPSIARDWGSAHDYVRAFALAASAPPGDYVVATGQLHRLSDIAAWALEAVGADPTLISSSATPDRPHDYGGVVGDTSLTESILGWRPARTLRQEIEAMVADLLSG